MAKKSVKSQDKIDNRRNLMRIVGAVVNGSKVEFSNPTEDLIIFDVETSGLDKETDKIVQFSAIKCKVEDGNLVEVARLDQYINQPIYDENKVIPGHNGDPDSTFYDLTGITKEMLADKPTEAEAFPIIRDFLGDNPNILAYNTPFDYGMLVQMYISNGEILHIDDDHRLDGLVMARDLVSKEDAPILLTVDGNQVLGSDGKPKRTHKLSYIAGLYGLDMSEDEDGKKLSFHSSINDVIATKRIVNVFIKEYIEQIEAELTEPKVTQNRAQIQSINYWAGYRGFSRIYINAILDGDAVSYYYDVRKKEWGEKTEGTIAATLMDDLKRDALELAGCADEAAFSKITTEIVADATFLSRYE